MGWLELLLDSTDEPFFLIQKAGQTFTLGLMAMLWSVSGAKFSPNDLRSGVQWEYRRW